MFFMFCLARADYRPHGKSMLFKKDQMLVFHKGRDTTYKRSSPIPQLRCMRGCEFEPGISLSYVMQLNLSISSLITIT